MADRRGRAVCRFEKKWADSVVTSLERGQPPHEQVVPLTGPVLRRLGAAATGQVDVVLVLSLVGALFSAARPDCFLHLWPHDIHGMSDDRLRAVLHTSRVKGGSRAWTLCSGACQTPLQAQTSSGSAPPWVPLCCVRMRSFGSCVQRLGPLGRST